MSTKHDQGKPRLELVLMSFNRALTKVGEVGTFGAIKYSDDDWKTVPQRHARYTGAMLRHLLAEPDETHDPESKLLHAAHVAWNALARLQIELTDGDGGCGAEKTTVKDVLERIKYDHKYKSRQLYDIITDIMSENDMDWQ